MAEYKAYKAKNKELVVEISNAKARCWSELLDTVDCDILGQPYKIVMKLSKKTYTEFGISRSTR